MTENKHKALQALLVCPTRKDAAKTAGIDIRTLRRYFKDEEFIQEYKEAFGALLDEATKQAQRALSPAIMTLTEICEDKEAGQMARISAARSLLEYGLKLGEYNDLSERVAELERLSESK